MRIPHKKKLVAAALAGVVVIVGAGTAYAYWSADGAGTAASGTVSATAALQVVQTSTLDPMFPGDTAQNLSGTFNNSGDPTVHVATVTASIDSVTDVHGGAITCSASDYSLTGAAMSAPQEVVSGNAEGAWTGAKIQFRDSTTSNQDGCRGAVVHLSYAVS